MERVKVLLVEDESTLAMIIKNTLDAQGFDIVTASDGEDGLRHFAENKPQVVVADVMMPRMGGFEMVRRIREHDSTTPVLFLTARSSVEDVVKGFREGGDDYLRKPFGMQELIVRLQALIRRSAPMEKSPDNLIAIGKYTLDANTQKLVFEGHEENLSYREAQILRMLACSEGNVVETATILKALWGDDSFFNSRSLQVFITKLRHKLAGDSGISIINVRGIGYRLVKNR